MELEYSNLKNKLANAGLIDLLSSVKLDIVSAIYSAIDGDSNPTDEEFDLMCQLANDIYHRAEYPRANYIGEVVSDVIYHNYKFSDCDDINVSFEDIRKWDLSMRDEVYQAYTNRANDLY